MMPKFTKNGDSRVTLEIQNRKYVIKNYLIAQRAAADAKKKKGDVMNNSLSKF